MVTHDELGDRGQLILIGAVLVAVTVIGSIVLLNSVHESPNVYTQQESQSLDETDRVVEEVRDNLERVFLVNTSVQQSGEALPYAREDTFRAILDAYERQYTNLSTVHTAGLVQVNLTSAQTGGIARQTGDSISGYQQFPNGTIIDSADEIPWLHLYINDTESSDFVLQLEGSSDTVEMRINESGVRGDVDCSLGSFDAMEIHLENRTGSITTSDAYCEIDKFGSSLTSHYTVRFDGGDNAEGSFTVTGVNPARSDISGSLGDQTWFLNSNSSTNYIVNPVYNVSYRNPDLTYSSTFGLYNGTGP